MVTLKTMVMMTKTLTSTTLICLNQNGSNNQRNYGNNNGKYDKYYNDKDNHGNDKDSGNNKHSPIQTPTVIAL